MGAASHAPRRSRALGAPPGSVLPPTAEPLTALPGEVLNLISRRLSQEDVGNAALVCKAWAATLRAGITRATLVCSDATPPARALASLSSHSPGLRELRLLLSGRDGQAGARPRAAARAAVLPGLRHVTLTFLASTTPHAGVLPGARPLVDAGLVLRPVHGLTSLKLEGLTLPDAAVKVRARTDPGRRVRQKHERPHTGRAAAPPPPPPPPQSLLGALERCSLKALDIRLGMQPQRGQLPKFRPPSWLAPGPGGSEWRGLRVEHMAQLGRLTSLQHLEFQLAEPVGPVSTAFKPLAKLKALTSLQLVGPIPECHTSCLTSCLTGLTQLRRLAVGSEGSGAAWSAAAGGLAHVRELNLRLCRRVAPAGPPNAELPGVFASLHSALCGLSLLGVAWEADVIELIAARLPGLTLLELQVAPPRAPAPLVDLGPLRALCALRKLYVHVTPTPGLAVRFGDAGSGGGGNAEPQRDSDGGRDQTSTRVRRTSKRLSGVAAAAAAAQPAPASLASLLAAWPGLDSLGLRGLSPTAVPDGTVWDFRCLTALTRLVLQFTPSAEAIDAAMAAPAPARRGAAAVASPHELLAARLSLGALPAGLQTLHLTCCSLDVPRFPPFAESLTVLSLSHCWLQRGWAPPPPPPPPQRGAAPGCAAAGAAGPEPLVALLRGLGALEDLELAEFHPSQLNDALLAAAAAGPAPDGGAALRGLTSLAVLGIGNQGLTHGGLAGLSGLARLRVLRWHVGDALAPAPAPSLLAALRGLVSLHVPTFLHAALERWGGYAVLQDLRACDVHGSGAAAAAPRRLPAPALRRRAATAACQLPSLRSERASTHPRDSEALRRPAPAAPAAPRRAAPAALHQQLAGGMAALPPDALLREGPYVWSVLHDHVEAERPCAVKGRRPVRLPLVATVPAAATPTAAVPPGPFPVLLLLNGFQARASYYTPLARRLASWGVVVCQYNAPALTIIPDAAELPFLGEVVTWLKAAAESQPALQGRADLTRLLVGGHSRGGKLAALHYAAGAVGGVPLRGAFLIDPVDNTKFTAESAEYPSATKALRAAGRPFGMAAAGIVGSSNPEGSNWRAFEAAAPAGSWALVLRRAGHTTFMKPPTGVETWLLDRIFGGGPMPRDAAISQTAAAMLAWFGEQQLLSRGAPAHEAGGGGALQAVAAAAPAPLAAAGLAAAAAAAARPAAAVAEAPTGGAAEDAADGGQAFGARVAAAFQAWVASPLAEEAGAELRVKRE
ncbi:Chlorophyllase-1 [Scenedesmus sp. PABB004]|nr:Chlorophyllase-1 [Scenedesmus sp. PABB004]